MADRLESVVAVVDGNYDVAGFWIGAVSGLADIKKARVRMSAYDVIYMLKPVREIEPGWWVLKWRPIFRQTWSAYCRPTYSECFGIWSYRSDARNGWNRSFKHCFLEVGLWRWKLIFWVRWNFVVHKNGPTDTAVLRPLVLPVGAS